MADYDNTNQGALFDPRSEKLVRTGKINIDGKDYFSAIIETNIPDGNGGTKKIYSTYLQVGQMFKTDKKKENDSDFDGSLEFPTTGKKAWYRAKVSNDGKTKFTSVSLGDLRAPNAGPAAMTAPPSPAGGNALDDDIPF